MLKYKKTILNLPILLGSLYSSICYSDTFFNSALISSFDGEVADLSRFDKGEGQPEGVYLVEIYINDDYVDYKNILFYQSDKSTDDTGLLPCLSEEQLKNIGVILNKENENTEKNALIF